MSFFYKDHRLVSKLPVGCFGLLPKQKQNTDDDEKRCQRSSRDSRKHDAAMVVVCYRYFDIFVVTAWSDEAVTAPGKKYSLKGGHFFV